MYYLMYNEQSKTMYQKFCNFIFSILLFIFTSITAFDVHGFGVTVLTKPIGFSGTSWFHKGVIGSILRGFDALQVTYNYNVMNMEQVHEVVWVVTNRNALKQAIDLKKNGKIKTILAGPNFVVIPSEEPLLKHPMVDAMIVHSQETEDLYALDEPALLGRLRSWFVGVDPSFWDPLPCEKSNTVLVYWKSESESFCSTVENILKEYGWNPIRIKYGSYKLDHYRQLLNKSQFAVFISKSESQGIALAESWAMDVPTIVWNPQEWQYKQHKFPLSSCPYLSSSTGLVWKSFNDFREILKNIKIRLPHFSPRMWAIEHMSDKASAECFLTIVNSIM